MNVRGVRLEWLIESRVRQLSLALLDIGCSVPQDRAPPLSTCLMITSVSLARALRHRFACTVKFCLDGALICVLLSASSFNRANVSKVGGPHLVGLRKIFSCKKFVEKPPLICVGDKGAKFLV